MERATRRRVTAGLAVLILITAGASYWYWYYESLSPVDAVYQTVITISTVGFTELVEFTEATRLVTIAVILLGAGTTAYTLTALFEHFADDRIAAAWRRRMERSSKQMSNHLIVCGYGRIGSRLAREAAKQGDVVVVDNDPEHIEEAEAAGLTVIRGDGTDEEALDAAGVGAAAVLVAALSSDADNLYIVMASRARNPGLRIVSRCHSERASARLRQAGADRVINPEEMGANRMLAFATRPNVSEFLDVMLHDHDVEFELDEVQVEAEGVKREKVTPAGIRRMTGAVPLALVDNGSYRTQPGDDEVIAAGMTIIALGTKQQIRALRRQVDPEGEHKREMQEAGWPRVV